MSQASIKPARTSIAIDRVKAREVREILGTKTIAETVPPPQYTYDDE